MGFSGFLGVNRGDSSVGICGVADVDASIGAGEVADVVAGVGDDLEGVVGAEREVSTVLLVETGDDAGRWGEGGAVVGGVGGVGGVVAAAC